MSSWRMQKKRAFVLSHINIIVRLHLSASIYPITKQSFAHHIINSSLTG